MSILLLQQLEYESIDLIIHSGFVIDPLNKIHDICDVIVSNGRIVDIVAQSTSQQRSKAKKLFDATDKIVTPGLIDLHAHVYQHATPLGVDPDRTCLSRGVTTVVDAGSSGASTFNGLREFIAKKSNTRVLSFIHITMHGLASSGCSGFGKGGELDSLNQVNEEWARRCLRENSDMVVGVKIRLSADCADGGKNEIEAFKRARSVTTKENKPLMVHHTFSSIPHEGLNGALGGLNSGDIYTHCMHGFPSTIIRSTNNNTGDRGGGVKSGGSVKSGGTKIEKTTEYFVCQAAKDARARGVLFDVGHGAGSFSWTVAEVLAKEKFWPDTISTDLHAESCGSPCYDLCVAMSKMKNVGMALNDIIRAVTITPACAIGWDDRIGSLTKGFVADITVLETIKSNGGLMVEDFQGQVRMMNERYQAFSVFKNGKQFPVTTIPTFPNYCNNPDDYDSVAALARWEQLIVRDEHPPNFDEIGKGKNK
jgi:dihydroorotase